MLNFHTSWGFFSFPSLSRSLSTYGHYLQNLLPLKFQPLTLLQFLIISLPLNGLFTYLLKKLSWMCLKNSIPSPLCCSCLTILVQIVEIQIPDTFNLITLHLSLIRLHICSSTYHWLLTGLLLPSKVMAPFYSYVLTIQPHLKSLLEYLPSTARVDTFVNIAMPRPLS